MPYPILTLPYPFAKRLRHLLSPSELHELQIAAGHGVMNTLKPLVPSCNVYGLSFHGIDGTHSNAGPTCELYSISTEMTYTSINISKNDKNLIECERIDLRGMSNIVFKNLALSNLLIKVPKINFEQSHVSNAFLKSVSAITLKSSLLNIYDCHCDEDVTFLTIIDIFTRVTTLYLNKAYFGWLNDLSSVGKRLEFVFILHHNFEETFNFQPEELYDFVAKQGPNFQLHIRIDNYGINLNDKVKQFIDPRFQLGDFKKANLIVSTDNNTGPVRQTPYVVNSLKRQEKTFPKHLITKMPRNL